MTVRSDHYVYPYRTNIPVARQKKLNDERMYVAGNYVPKSHPAHQPGHFDAWPSSNLTSPALRAARQEAEDTIGHLYDEAFDAQVARERRLKYTRADRDYDRTSVGYLYVARRLASAYVKVGYSKTPRGRIAAANTFLAPEERVELMYVRLFKDAKVAERIIHAILQSAGTRVGTTELFLANTDKVIDLIKGMDNE